MSASRRRCVLMQSNAIEMHDSRSVVAASLPGGLERREVVPPLEQRAAAVIASTSSARRHVPGVAPLERAR